MSDGRMDEIEADLMHLWENYRVEPTYLQMQLAQLRKLAAERDDTKDYVVQFLEDTKDLPETAIAVLTPGHISILTDDDGHLLEFA